MSTSRPILHNLQSMRGLAVLLVVLLHLHASERQYSPDQLLPGWLEFGIIGVDIFFVISGFIMVTVTGLHAHSPREAGHFLLLRLARIYPAYWVVSLSLIVALTMFPGIASVPSNELGYYVKSLLLYPQPVLPLLFVGWTLVHELFFYLVFALLLLLPGFWRLLALLAWAIASAWTFEQWHPPVWEPERVILVSPLSLEFIAGCLAGWLCRHRMVPGGSAILLAGLLAVAGSVWHWSSLGKEGMPADMARIAYFLPPALLLVLGAAAMEQRGQRFAGWLERIGDASYSIYLTHMLAIAPLFKLWHFLTPAPGLADNAWVLSGGLALTLGGGILFADRVEKPLLAWCRRTLRHRQVIA